MEAVDEQIAELKARIKELEEIKLRLEIPFVEAMGQATVGMIPAREMILTMKWLIKRESKP